MQIIRDLSTLYDALDVTRTAGDRVALVPTMGALHDGHMSLVREGRRHADRVVVSIFVNPTQFGPNEDFDAYPRTEEADVALLAAERVDILWAPTVPEMYPAGFATTVSLSGISEVLDGAARPGHFDGVATVVSKLLGQVRPDVALFGEKDYQQLAVIRRLVIDLNLRTTIIGVPTARAADGLALSSRNAYLTAPERAAALALPRALNDAAQAIRAGAPVAAALDAARAAIRDAGFTSIDYVTLCDTATLQPLESLDRAGRLLAAARIGLDRTNDFTTRLIDNIAVNP
ncbi:pantoate--beta-alanine ligase [Sphingobium sufflavum]|uniref:pantoate--beta-alanine ligase n=1 Tax=Sphingobium sufflavum TaxID=1129547 RepID=UPI001F456EC5|nr:pantoate--beta-alanine ligase [Sphingobium sufflavum]MCE7795522.1 pantoate--beta-alanine ligase [Sphingobium sufflavum]